MRRLLLWAALLGAFGALIRDLRVFIISYFFEYSLDIFVAWVLYGVFHSLFGICVLITKGIAEKSFRIAKIGVLFGIIVGAAVVLVGLVFDPRWPIGHLFSMMLLGLFAGLVWGFRENLRARQIYRCLGGLIGGALSIPILYLVINITILPETVLHFFAFEVESTLFVYIMDIIQIAALGAAQSGGIWFSIALADKYYSPGAGNIKVHL